MVLIAGVRFGNRIGYTPADTEEDFDDEYAREDAEYLRHNEDELNICMRYVRIAHEELLPMINSILEKPPAERDLLRTRCGLKTLLNEMYRDRDKVQTNVPHYAKVVIDIEARIARAQRYVVAHTPKK